MFDKVKENEVETRQIVADVEVRELDGEKPVLEGYALKFNKWSEVLGGFFREKIEPSALEKSDMSNVVALFNHNEEMLLGRSGVNLELEVDEIGLRFKINPTNTSYTRDLMENMKAGVINQCSFAMSDITDEFDDTPDLKGIYSRTILSIGKIHDVSIVTTPAYSDTEVGIGKRSLDKLKDVITTDEETRNKEVESKEPETEEESETYTQEELISLLDYETYI